jgi:hypothetical protein
VNLLHSYKNLFKPEPKKDINTLTKSLKPFLKILEKINDSIALTSLEYFSKI